MLSSWRPMSGSMLVLASLVCVLAVIALATGGLGRVEAAVREGIDLLTSVAPQLIVGFLLAGFVIVLVPPTTIARLVGAESGVLGLSIATAAGALTPGGPFLQFPLVAALLRGGAGEGQVAAYLTAWSLLGLQRVFVWELPVLGTHFVLVRWVVSLLVPVAVGLIVPVVLRATRPG